MHVSYLPLAHVFERAVQAVLWVRGAQIAFFRGNVLELPSDLMAARYATCDRMNATRRTLLLYECPERQ